VVVSGDWGGLGEAGGLGVFGRLGCTSTCRSQ